MRSLKRKLKRVRPLLGTFVEIELQGDAPEKKLSGLITEGFEAISEIDRLMSYHRSDSDLSRLNRAAPGAWVDLHPLTVKVLQASNELFLASQGAFDIRCGAVLADQGLLPNSPLGQLGVMAVPMKTAPVQLRGRQARKTGAWLLDLGGIAKGFAVDYAAQRLQRLSAGQQVSGVVNAGGDLRSWGHPTVQAATQISTPKIPLRWPFLLSRTAAATSSVSAPESEGLTVAAHVRMPSGELLKVAQTVTVFAKRCLVADALTKVVLLASADIAARCLAAYQAHAVIFEPGGRIGRVVA